MKKYVILFVGLFAMIGQIEAHPTTENRRIQELVDSLTRREMSNMGCHRGIVYVVETKTGKLIAHTSLEGSDDHFVPFTDTFYK